MANKRRRSASVLLDNSTSCLGISPRMLMEHSGTLRLNWIVFKESFCVQLRATSRLFLKRHRFSAESA